MHHILVFLVVFIANDCTVFTNLFWGICKVLLTCMSLFENDLNHLAHIIYNWHIWVLLVCFIGKYYFFKNMLFWLLVYVKLLYVEVALSVSTRYLVQLKCLFTLLIIYWNAIITKSDCVALDYKHQHDLFDNITYWVIFLS